MSEPLPRDPLVCECGDPKQANEAKCWRCVWRETEPLPTMDGRSIDDPPARDYPQAFGEGAD